ncbi:MAG: hypothetical protein ACHQD7_03710 [Chitinophagales bacterium]
METKVSGKPLRFPLYLPGYSPFFWYFSRPAMVTKTSVIDFFTRGKVIFVTIAAVITFSITLYNQFKSTPTTEISGYVSADKNSLVPVDAVVKIISPVQSQTETDARGRFKFKLQNIQSDTFLLVIQNKKTNIETKQDEYVNASKGRKDIFVLFNSSTDEEKVYAPLGKSTSPAYSRRPPAILKVLHQIFPVPRRRAH